jgi:hypothetical protein
LLHDPETEKYLQKEKSENEPEPPEPMEIFIAGSIEDSAA